MDSALNGLKLVLRHQYVALLFGISCLYEVVLTILDYQMKVLRERRCFFSSNHPLRPTSVTFWFLFSEKQSLFV